MDDAQRAAVLVRARMRMVQRAGQLGAHVEREARRQGDTAHHRGGDIGVEREARDTLHEDVENALDLGPPEHAGDVGMIQEGGQPRLLLQPGAYLRECFGRIAGRGERQTSRDVVALGAQA